MKVRHLLKILHIFFLWTLKPCLQIFFTKYIWNGKFAKLIFKEMYIHVYLTCINVYQQLNCWLHILIIFFLDDIKQQQIDSILVSTCLISTIGIWKWIHVDELVTFKPYSIGVFHLLYHKSLLLTLQLARTYQAFWRLL